MTDDQPICRKAGAESLVGQTVGKYEIVRFLAQGGMGALYLAEHTLLRRECVLKTISPHLHTDQEVLRRFLREIRLGAMLMHPNIILFYDAGIEQDFCYLVMEHFPGEDLSKRYKDNPGKVDEVVHFGAQVASALTTAHADGILHRDIKPHNVLVNEESVAKVCDFGMAKAIANPEFSQITTDAGIIGSPVFMAPEALESAGEITQETDIYGLGAVLYYCLTGRPPYEGKNSLQVIQQIGKPFPPPSHFRNDVPKPLEALILRAMAPDKRNRFESAEEMRQVLQSNDVFRETTDLGVGDDDIWPESAMTRQDVETGEKTRPKISYLRIFGLKEGCREYLLGRRKHVIGRGEAVDLRLRHETVSRQHAVIEPLPDGGYTLRDLGSRAGVFVNGNLVDHAKLKPADLVQIAHFFLEYREDHQTLTGMARMDHRTQKLLKERFGVLPSGIALRYRLIYCPPEEVFQDGVIKPIGRGGILVPAQEKVDANVCVEVEIVLPEGQERRFMGEVLGMTQGPEGPLLCIKLYRVNEHMHQQLVNHCLCGKWADAVTPEAKA